MITLVFECRSEGILKKVVNIWDVLDFSPGCGRSGIHLFLADRATPGSIRIFGWISKLADFSTAAVHTDYLQLNIVKLVLACHHLSDLMMLHYSRLT